MDVEVLLSNCAHREYQPPIPCIKSGWGLPGCVYDGSKIGDTEIHNGDVTIDGDILVLNSLDTRKISLFQGLVPLEKWAGKTITSVQFIKGSGVVFGGRHCRDDEGAILMITFDDGSRSQLFAKAEVLVDTFEKEPDFDALVEAGIFSQRDKENREKEKKLYRNLRDREESLETERRSLQISLGATTNWLERRKIYKQIRSIEAKLVAIQLEQDNTNWEWACKVLNYEWLQKRNKRMLSPDAWVGRKILAVNKVVDSKDSDHNSPSTFCLQFDKEFKSVVVAMLATKWVMFPIDSLEAAGFISKDEMAEIEYKIKISTAETQTIKAKYDLLQNLIKKLDDYGLGAQNTWRIFQDIQKLQKELGIEEESE